MRPSHERMSGKIADEKGMFYSEDVGHIAGPGSGPTEFSVACRCSTQFLKKE